MPHRKGYIHMIDLRDKNSCPTMEEISEYVRNPLFMQFCLQIRERYQCQEKIEYSAFLLEALKNADCDEITFQLSGPLSPMKVVPTHADYFTFLVLPVRIRS